MEASVYEQFAQLERVHFWFRGRRKIFFDLLDRELSAAAGSRTGRVLEIGCGAGGMLEGLSRYGKVVGLDIAEDYLRYCRSRGFPDMVAASGHALPFADGGFDLVALFDTIEHIPDDAGVLREVGRVLRPGGTCFLSVPAYQFLYSQNDRLVYHQRRYTATSLSAVIREAGLEPVKVSYFNTFLFPLILPAVLVLKLKERIFGLPDGMTNLTHDFAAPINDAFAWAMGAERWLLRHMELPFGHSLIAIARPRAAIGGDAARRDAASDAHCTFAASSGSV